MNLTLTQWWYALADDLKKLKERKINDQFDYYKAANSMLGLGVQIEGNLIAAGAKGYDKQIKDASKKLGTAFIDVDGEKQTTWYLPDANTPESLLFAVIYHKHLSRFEHITEGNKLVVTRLVADRPQIKRVAGEIQKRINDYCSTPQNVASFNTSFPEIAKQNGETILDKINNWLADKPVEEKLIEQFEQFTTEIIQEHDVKKGDVKTLFENIESKLSGKVRLLREIASYKKMVELLNEGRTDINADENEFPGFAALWQNLNSSVPEEKGVNAFLANTALGATNVVQAVGRGIFNLGSKFSGVVPIPKTITDMASNVATTTSALVTAMTPDSLDEKRKKILIKKANESISNASNSLKNNEKTLFSARDFDTMKATEVNELADKIEIIRRMVALQKCLALYREEHSTTLVKFSLSTVFKPITELFSQTFMRPLIFDKVLLVMEARKLENELDALILSANTQYDKAEIKQQIATTLGTAKQRTEELVAHISESKYAFFKEESQAASKGLKEVVDRVLHISSPNK